MYSGVVYVTHSAITALPYVWGITVLGVGVFPVERIIALTSYAGDSNVLYGTMVVLVIITMIVAKVYVSIKYSAKLKYINDKMKDAIKNEKEFCQELSPVSLTEVKTEDKTEMVSVHTASSFVTIETVRNESDFMADMLFTPLLISTAAILSFSHGANNVANSVGAYDSIMIIFEDGMMDEESRDTPLWILLLGGVGIALGIMLVGYKVMDTIGKKITTITRARGYAVQLSSTLVLMAATALGLPVSTTHVVIGAGMCKDAV